MANVKHLGNFMFMMIKSCSRQLLSGKSADVHVSDYVMRCYFLQGHLSKLRKTKRDRKKEEGGR